MKFCFTNKTLLIAASAGALVCNLLAPYITFLPLLWVVCFIEGICKIQGTFECMSNIQLWMTPKRDFTVFFPLLHIVILGSMQYNPQIKISAESETKRSIFREKDKTKRSKKESAQHSKSRNKSFVMTSVSALFHKKWLYNGIKIRLKSLAFCLKNCIFVQC